MPTLSDRERIHGGNSDGPALDSEFLVRMLRGLTLLTAVDPQQSGKIPRMKLNELIQGSISLADFSTAPFRKQGRTCSFGTNLAASAANFASLNIVNPSDSNEIAVVTEVNGATPTAATGIDELMGWNPLSAATLLASAFTPLPFREAAVAGATVGLAQQLLISSLMWGKGVNTVAAQPFGTLIGRYGPTYQSNAPAVLYPGMQYALSTSIINAALQATVKLAIYDIATVVSIGMFA